jgi:hypothetical protein
VKICEPKRHRVSSGNADRNTQQGIKTEGLKAMQISSTWGKRQATKWLAVEVTERRELGTTDIMLTTRLPLRGTHIQLRFEVLRSERAWAWRRPFHPVVRSAFVRFPDRVRGDCATGASPRPPCGLRKSTNPKERPVRRLDRSSVSCRRGESRGARTNDSEEPRGERGGRRRGRDGVNAT